MGGGGEVFVDAGSFDGKTAKLFMDWSNGQYKKIYALEPEKGNIAKCEENLTKARAKYEIIPKGLWDSAEELRFTEGESGASHISTNTEGNGSNDTCISVDALDHLINDRVTFIKMDIEGAEYKALQGARRIISECHPKLAISIYHKPEDIWELPELILDICPDYRFYLRHYSIAQAETVLYGV